MIKQGDRVRWTDPDPIEDQITKDGIVVMGDPGDEILAVAFDDGSEAEVFTWRIGFDSANTG